MAAAYHWEARRRQMLVEKRLRLMQARVVSEGMEHPDVPKEVPPSELPQNSPPPQGIKEDACPCHTDHVLKHSGKLLKRYTAVKCVVLQAAIPMAPGQSITAYITAYNEG